MSTGTLTSQQLNPDSPQRPPPFIISLVISSLTATFPFLSLPTLSSSYWISSKTDTFPNPMYCNLFLSIYIIQIFKIILPDPSHFIPSLCQPPISILYSAATLHLSSFHITHLLPKQLLFLFRSSFILLSNCSFTLFLL